MPNSFSSEEIDNAFKTWRNERLITRRNFLQNIATGDADTVTEIMNSPLVDLSFPGGFDPGTNPQHNLTEVKNELDRRSEKTGWAPSV